MSTSAPPRLITAEQFAEMSFDGPVELVRGEIVELTRPDQSHGNVCFEVAKAIDAWACLERSGRVTTNDSRIVTQPDLDTVRGADVAFFSISQLPDGKLPRGQTTLAPVLCVEVLSHSNTWTETRRKIDEYLEAGVREVWIVDPDMRTVEAFRSDRPAVLFRHSQSLTSSELAGFETLVSELFAGIE